MAASTASASKTGEASTSAPASQYSASKKIHVTQAGKMRTYVHWTLVHLNTHPDNSVTLHTAPISLSSPSTNSLTSNANPTTIPAIPIAEKENKSKKSSRFKQSRYHSTSLLPCSSTIPRLVSVVEVIKREFYTDVKSSMPEGSLTGVHEGRIQQRRLWQYNRIVYLTRAEREASYPRATATTRPKKTLRSDAGSARDQREDAQLDDAGRQLRDLLGGDEDERGSKNIHMLHTPYMEITLSARALPHLHGQSGVTYQQIPPPKLSKSMKRGAKGDSHIQQKKSKKAVANISGVEEEETSDADISGVPDSMEVDAMGSGRANEDDEEEEEPEVYEGD